MIIKIIKNWNEFRQSNLKRSVRPFFKGDSFHFSSFRSGAETYLRIKHQDVILEFWLELGRLGISIDGVDARESLALSDNVRNELKRLLADNDLPISERNRQVARLISENLN